MPNAKIAQWPTPWSLEPNARRNFVDANGKYIGCCSVDDASALVVEAVNNRDELENTSLRLADAVIAFRDYARKIENELLHCHRDLGGEISQRLIDLVTVAASLDGPEMAFTQAEGPAK